MNWAAIGKKLLKNLTEIKRKRCQIAVPETGRHHHIPLYSLEEGGTPQPLVLMFTPEEIATQLTLIDMEIYKRINPKEILNKKWNDSINNLVCRNLLDLIDRVNLVSYWAATEIIMPQVWFVISKYNIYILENFRQSENHETNVSYSSVPIGTKKF